jgi:hypothetical protein
MSDPGYERLINLLPAIYRQRDLQQGQPLRALMASLQSQLLTLQADIEALYDNWFIETADDWVVPYIADLVGIADLSEARNQAFSQRRRVANAIAYRRRKGLMATLEHVAQDVTDWSVHVLDYGTLVTRTQHQANPRPADIHLVDLRPTGGEDALSALGGPFEAIAHTADVRTLSTDPTKAGKGGKYRPDHLGIFVWRLNSYPIILSPARAILKDAGGHRLPPCCYTFDPLGRDLPLFVQPDEVARIGDRTTPANLAMPLSRVALAQDLAAYAARYAGSPPQNWPQSSNYYGPDRSLFVIVNDVSISPGAVISADLSLWSIPSQLSDPASGVVAAVDPHLGRLVLSQRRHRGERDLVEVNFNFGFSADLGGGSYPRSLSLVQPQPDTLQLDVVTGGPLDSLAKALAAWEKVSKDQPRCIITLQDSGVYAVGRLAIRMPKNCQLVIQAADGQRPVLLSDDAIVIENKPGGASLVLNGLLVDGRIELVHALNLTLSHCTLMPHGLAVSAEAAGRGGMPALQVTVDSSILGPLRLPAISQGLTVTNSILDGLSEPALAGPKPGSPGPLVDLQNVTIFGAVHVRQVRQASGVIFGGPLRVDDTHTGLVSFSYVPPGSHTPRRESCEPHEPHEPGEEPESAHFRSSEETLEPTFSSTRFGDPAYAQLGLRCPAVIRRGAANGGEMGAFHDLFLVQRQDNLKAILDEFMPFGLEAGIFFVT